MNAHRSAHTASAARAWPRLLALWLLLVAISLPAPLCARNQTADAPSAAPEVAEQSPAALSEERRDPNRKMSPNWDVSVPFFSLALKVGQTHYMKANLRPGFTLPSRHGALLKLSFDLGGEGFCPEIAPVYIYEVGPDWFGNMHALGLYLGINWRWRWWNFVPSLGFGVRGTYLLGENIDRGMEVFGRVPLALTWYVSEDLNILFELGFGYGATGVRAPALDVDALRFGHSFALDILLGMRFL